MRRTGICRVANRTGSGLARNTERVRPVLRTSTAWYVVRGTLADGTEADLLYPLVHDDFETIRLVSWDQPDFIGKTLYRGEHWHKYLNLITFRVRRRSIIRQRRHVIAFQNPA